MSGSGHIIIVNLHTSSSDNCVSTVQPQYLPQHLFPLANCIYPWERKKEDTLESLRRGPVENAILRLNFCTDVHNTEYGQCFLYLNNGGILGTDLFTN